MPSHPPVPSQSGADAAGYWIAAVLALAWVGLIVLFLARRKGGRRSSSSPVRHRRANVALAGALAYLLAAWAFSGCLLMVRLFTGRPPDTGFWQVFWAAPVAVPMLTLQHPSLEMVVWLGCILMTWFVVFRVMRRIVAGLAVAADAER